MSNGPQRKLGPATSKKNDADSSTEDARDWYKEPETIQDWLALFILENMDVVMLNLFYRYMAQRTKSELIIQQSTALLTRSQPRLQASLKGHLPKALAMVRQILLQENGATELADSLDKFIYDQGNVIANLNDKSNVVAKRVHGEHENSSSKSKVPPDYKK